MSDQVIVILALGVLFLVLMLLPFLPGIVELFHPRDDKPLVIKLAHAKEARYFGRSFRTRMKEALPEPQPGIHNIILSKPEAVTVAETIDMGPGEKLNDITWVRGSMGLAAGCSVRREVLVDGNASLATDVTVRAMACNGNLTCGQNLTIMRWLDVEGDAAIESRSNLGQSCTAGGRLQLEPGSRFRHLFGAPTCVGNFTTAPSLAGLKQPRPRDPELRIRRITDVAHRTRSFRLAPGEVADFDVISTHDVVIDTDCQVLGTIKARGPVVIKSGAIVTGSVFSESDITLEEGARVLKNVFSQGRVEVHGNAVVGKPDAVCSVVARDRLTLHGLSAVYGYLCTDGEGVVAL